MPAWSMMLAALATAAVACRTAAPTAIDPAPPPVPAAAAPRAPAAAPAPPPVPAAATGPVPATAPPAAVACASDERRWGTTCCRAPDDDREQRTPGMVFLTCTGPQVGQPCSRKGDCDIACSCDPPTERRRPGGGRGSPADGTRGVTGTCAGALQVGVWMCQLDEQGAVTHVIVD